MPDGGRGVVQAAEEARPEELALPGHAGKEREEARQNVIRQEEREVIRAERPLPVRLAVLERTDWK